MLVIETAKDGKGWLKKSILAALTLFHVCIISNSGIYIMTYKHMNCFNLIAAIKRLMRLESNCSNDLLYLLDQ